VLQILLRMRPDPWESLACPRPPGPHWPLRHCPVPTCAPSLFGVRGRRVRSGRC